MASCGLFSTTFSAPLCCCPPPTSLKVMCRERFDLGRVSHKAAAVSAPNLPARCSSNLNKGFFSLLKGVLGYIAICYNVASAYPEQLQLTWISHDPLASCPENGHTKCFPTPVFEALVTLADYRCVVNRL